MKGEKEVKRVKRVKRVIKVTRSEGGQNGQKREKKKKGQRNGVEPGDRREERTRINWRRVVNGAKRRVKGAKRLRRV